MLVEDVCSLTLVNLVADTVVRANDADKLVGQVVLHLVVVVHHNRRTDCERRNRKDSADHPLGAGVDGVKPNLPTVLGCHALEGAKNELGLKRHGGNSLRSLGNRIRTLKSRRLSDNLGHLGEQRRMTGVACQRTLSDVLAILLEASHTRGLLRGLRRNGLGAVQADEVCELLCRVEELIEVDRTCELNVTEVSGTRLVRLPTRRTHLAILDDTEPSIEDAVCDWLCALVGLVCRNFHDTTLPNVLGIGDAELNSNDRIAHCVLLISMCRFFRFLPLAPRQWKRVRNGFGVLRLVGRTSNGIASSPPFTLVFLPHLSFCLSSWMRLSSGSLRWVSSSSHSRASLSSESVLSLSWRRSSRTARGRTCFPRPPEHWDGRSHVPKR